MIKTNVVNKFNPSKAIKYNIKQASLLVSPSNSKQVEYISNKYIKDTALSYSFSFVWENNTFTSFKGNISHENVNLVAIENNNDIPSCDTVICVNNIEGDYFYCQLDTNIGSISQMLKKEGTEVKIPLPSPFILGITSLQGQVSLLPKDESESLSVLDYAR